VSHVILDADGDPSGQRYQLAEAGSSHPAETCVEFLVPWQGPARRRRCPEGLLPTALRYVELLLESPLRLELAEFGTLLVAHPLSLIVQKTIIREHRRVDKRTDKRGSDQADILYVLWGFQPGWSGWRKHWETLVRVPAWRRWLGDARAQWRTLYHDAHAPGSREVAQIHAQLGGPAFTAATAARIMQDFLRELP
jgi:hypothetical protein